jgi:beta-xylosidase
LSQGKTSVNGPHQGSWIELENGQNWFIHFQELQPFGRIVHLQPVNWIDDWPVIGNDSDGNGIGEPVLEFKKPKIKNSSSLKVPQASDEFNNNHYNLAWLWQANYFEHWYSLSEKQGFLRLYAQYHNSPSSLWMVPNILAQKIPGPQFIAAIKMDGSNLKQKEKAGLVILGLDYSSLSISPVEDGYKLNQTICKNASKGYSEEIKYSTLLNSGIVYLRVEYTPDGSCHFAFSLDNKNYTEIGEPFHVREGKWIGAKIGLFATAIKETGIKGYADFDWFRID